MTYVSTISPPSLIIDEANMILSLGSQGLVVSLTTCMKSEQNGQGVQVLAQPPIVEFNFVAIAAG